MFIIIGIIVVFIMVFGGFVLSGGKFGIIIKALPFELMMIFGGSFGAFISGNQKGVLVGALKGIGKAAKGSKWKKDDYVALLSLIFMLFKTMKSKGIVAVETHVENPEDSAIFNNFSTVSSDHHVVEFICDYLRMLTMNFEDPHQMEDAMDKDLERHHAEEHDKQHALQIMADGLPAIGIVAAVLGIIKTMGSINQPVEVLGQLVGGALVGTFLGIFLSYLLIAPIAQRLGQVLSEEARFFDVIKVAVVSYLQGNAPQVAVELARRNVPGHLQPTFKELDDALSELPNEMS